MFSDGSSTLNLTSDTIIAHNRAKGGQGKGGGKPGQGLGDNVFP